MKNMKRMTAWGMAVFLLIVLTGCTSINREQKELIAVDALKVQIEETEQSVEREEVFPEVILQGEDIGIDEPLKQDEDTEISYEIVKSDSSYFDDALFIGDSRTVGLREYGLFDNADYFATPGLSIYSIPNTEIAIHDSEKISFEKLLEQKDYGKIYLMLGMNELGYNFETTLERYRAFVEDLQTKEPEAILYLCANMHVTITRSENDEIFNNANINKINSEIEALAEEKNLPFLNVNTLFDDESGNLNEEYTSDDSHVLGKYYESWCEWLQDQTVIKN